MTSSVLEKIIHFSYTIISRVPFAKKTLSHTGIKNVIDFGRKKGIIQEIDHYKDSYWNELNLVQQYICENATGNKDTIWQIDILTRFKEFLPFKNVLIIGCGNGWVERQLSDLKIGLHFDAFDISKKYLDTAKKQAGNRNIRYFVADINHLNNLKQSHYDAVFNVGTLHHTFRLSHTLWNISKSLKQNGLMFNFDYGGPAQNQYSDEHLSIMENINKQLPKRFQTPHKLRPSKEDFEFGDPTEAINSDLIRSIFERFFDIVYQRDLNGGVAYQILINNIQEFEKNDEEAIKVLKFLIEKDAQYTKLKKVPVLFWYSVGTPKPKNLIKNFQTLPP